MKWYLEVARKYAVFNGRSHGKSFGLSLFSLAHLLPIISIDIGKTLETDINLYDTTQDSQNNNLK